MKLTTLRPRIAAFDTDRLKPASRVRTREGGSPYDLRAWRDRIRPRKLREDPLCEYWCKAEGRLTPATQVDHRDGDPFNNDPQNLVSACATCHSRKTAMQDGGFGNKPGRRVKGSNADGSPKDPAHNWNKDTR